MKILKIEHDTLISDVYDISTSANTFLAGDAKIVLHNCGYHHGESSAAAAIVTLTADWNNNCPIFTGHGNFGSRLVQEASAPRYIFASLSPEFKKIFIDTEVAPVSLNEENPEPAHYLPIIPWVLVNGISGIAVGFATDILPRSIADLAAATKACVKNKTKFLEKNEPIAPTFPHFHGTIKQETETGLKWSTTGIIDYVGKNQFKISELPIGYDREAYVVLLNTMIDKDLIKDYDDDCSENGFGFTVKTTLAQKAEIEKDPIKYFKLQKMHSENLTTMGSDGKLKIFSSVSELIAYFCDYRLSKFSDKIAYDKAELSEEILRLEHKLQFIDHVLNEHIDVRKSTKQELLEYIEKYIHAGDWAKAFIRIPLYEITQDEVTKLYDCIVDKKKTLAELDLMTPEKLFSTKLGVLK